MPTSTYIALANLTLSANDSDITFSSIPATYKDLVVIINGKFSSGGGFKVSFNGDTTDANYRWVYMYGTGASAVSAANDTAVFGFLGTEQSIVRMNIMNYSSTSFEHPVLNRIERITDSDFTMLLAGKWRSTNAINSIRFYNATFLSGATFAIYGIEG